MDRQGGRTHEKHWETCDRLKSDCLNSSAHLNTATSERCGLQASSFELVFLKVKTLSETTVARHIAT